MCFVLSLTPILPQHFVGARITDLGDSLFRTKFVEDVVIELSFWHLRPFRMSLDSSGSEVAELFQQQRSLISTFFSKFDHNQASEFVKRVLDCSGTVLLSGVGKSGFIANKIAMSFCSTGIRSVFINPLDALHGDIGYISTGDILVLLSKSGSTEELIQLIPVARARGVKVVCVTCSTKNRMSEESDLHVYLPLERELCLFNTAPVTSTILQLVFGDTVTVALMRARNLSKEAYAMNHPAGAIGRKLYLRVKDVMTGLAKLPCVCEATSVKTTLVKMSEGKLGCVFVCCANGTLLGVFTDGDLRRSLEVHGGELLCQPVSVHMNPCPRITGGEFKLTEVIETFALPFPVQCLPVVKPQGDVFHLIGAISAATASELVK